MKQSKTNLMVTQPRNVRGVRSVVAAAVMHFHVLRFECRVLVEQATMFCLKLVHATV